MWFLRLYFGSFWDFIFGPGIISDIPSVYSFFESTSLLYLSVGVVLWTLVYGWMCRIAPEWTAESHCRVIAVVHALVVVNMCAYSMFIRGPNVLADTKLIGSKNNDFQNTVCMVSLSYFIFDLLWSIIFQTEAPVMLMHHMLSIFGTSYVMYKGYMGPELMVTIFGSEMTNPLLQLRWFLYEAGLHKTWWAEMNTALFICMFGILRCIMGTWFMYTYVYSPIPSQLAKFGCLAFYIISMVFSFNIGIYAKKHYLSMFRDYKRTEAALRQRLAARRQRERQAAQEEAEEDETGQGATLETQDSVVAAADKSIMKPVQSQIVEGMFRAVAEAPKKAASASAAASLTVDT